MDCPSCGTANTEGEQFCSNCGTPMSAAAPETPAPEAMMNSSMGQPAATTGGRDNKRLIIIGLIIVAAAIAGYFVYKQFAHASPGAVTEDFFRATLEDKDCRKAVDLTSSKQIENRDEAIAACNEELQGIGNAKIVSFEITEEKIEGDKATVKYKGVAEINGEQEEDEDTVSLVKEDGDWKIDNF
jgi:hypothetical protein